MSRTVEAFAHAGDWWAHKVDTKHRHYAVREGVGRVPMEMYRRAKHNEPLTPEEEGAEEVEA